MTKYSLHPILLAAAVAVASMVVAAQQPPTSQQPSSVSLVIEGGDPGTPPRLAVPDLLAQSSDKETQEAARVIAQVLWDDLNYEREYYMIPRDTYKSVPPAGSIDTVPYDRWRELGADAVVIGSVQRAPNGVRVELRLYSVSARLSAFSKEYTGSVANPRLYAHTLCGGYIAKITHHRDTEDAEVAQRKQFAKKRKL